MQKHVLMLATSAFILACGAIPASAQQSPSVPMTQQPDQQQTQQRPPGHEPGMMGQGGMMGRTMMGEGGMMGRGMMRPPIMMRIIFSLMDSDGDGTISLQEFQAAHERIFKAMDANKDGRLTLEEDAPWWRAARRDGGSECGKRQTCIDPLADRIANSPSAREHRRLMQIRRRRRSA
jgi:hypothetical protein